MRHFLLLFQLFYKKLGAMNVPSFAGYGFYINDFQGLDLCCQYSQLSLRSNCNVIVNKYVSAQHVGFSLT